MERRPRIALNCDVTEETRVRARVTLTYVDYLAAAGALPLVLPPVPAAIELLEEVDAVVFIGGDDYRTGVGSETPPAFSAVHPRREQGDFALAGAALSRALPVLGICGGFQLLALASGGRLHGDLPTDLPASNVRHRRSTPDEPAPAHEIRWETACARTGVAPGAYWVNSHHHQAVRDLPASWQVLARAPDGVIEAACGPSPFCVGVQWHPELEPDAPLSQALVQGLLAAARRARCESARR